MMGPARARRIITRLAATPDVARTASAVAYGAALGLQLYFVRTLTENPEKVRASAMRRSGSVTAAIEGGFYDAALERLGDDYLAAQEAHYRKYHILEELRTTAQTTPLDETSQQPQNRVRHAIARSFPTKMITNKLPRKPKAISQRTVHALGSSIVGPPPLIGSAYLHPPDYRELWIPDDSRVEHQLLVALEELWDAPLPAVLPTNLGPYRDPHTGLLMMWDDAALLAGIDALNKAVSEYLLDSRYGDGIRAGAEAFIAARRTYAAS